MEKSTEANPLSSKMVVKKLVDFVHSKIDFSKSIVANPWEAKYQLFQRENHFDEITQVMRGKSKWIKH